MQQHAAQKEAVIAGALGHCSGCLMSVAVPLLCTVYYLSCRYCIHHLPGYAGTSSVLAVVVLERLLREQRQLQQCQQQQEQQQQQWQHQDQREQQQGQGNTDLRLVGTLAHEVRGRPAWVPRCFCTTGSCHLLCSTQRGHSLPYQPPSHGNTTSLPASVCCLEPCTLSFIVLCYAVLCCGSGDDGD